MKSLAFIVTIFVQTPDWGLLLEKAHHDQETTEFMIQELNKIQTRSSLETAYLGSAEMLMAKHS